MICVQASINYEINDAISAFKQSLELKPRYAYSILPLAICFRKLGNELEANKLISSVESFIGKEKEYFQACFLISIGNIDDGLHFLKAGLDQRQTSKAWARQDPNFEILHDNPRFRELVGLK